MEEYAGGCLIDNRVHVTYKANDISDGVDLFNYHVRYIATKLRTPSAEVDPVFEIPFRHALTGNPLYFPGRKCWKKDFLSPI